MGHADLGVHNRHYDHGMLLDYQDPKRGAEAIAVILTDILSIDDGTTVYLPTFVDA
jgi:hypothetical protein